MVLLQTKTENVEYTVGIPGGAAIMLDKMNVFYIGVDNPITISSGSGWDKTNVIYDWWYHYAVLMETG